jgi:hypothetical protein
LVDLEIENRLARQELFRGVEHFEFNKEIPMKPFHLSIILISTLLLAACAPVFARDAVTPQPSPTPTTEIAVLVWHRSGGFAGFCDEVTVYESGSADVVNCKGDVRTRIQLTATQREQLDNWLKTLKPIDYTRADPATTDAMSVSLFLAGTGTQTADEQTIGLVSQFASKLAAQAYFNVNAPPEKDEAEQVLRDYLSALNSGDFTLGAKLYGGDTELLQTWNPDITNDLPTLFERACTQNGLVCMLPTTVTYRGTDSSGAYQFLVEFSNSDGTLFRQGPCCGETEGPSVTSFLFRVVKIESGYAVLDLPPYVP